MRASVLPNVDGFRLKAPAQIYFTRPGDLVLRTVRAAIADSALVISAGFAFTASAQDQPSAGVTVHPIKGSPTNAWFQHMVVQIGLEKLGYPVAETSEADFPALHLAIASSDADYTVNNSKPLHDNFYEKSGGTR